MSNPPKRPTPKPRGARGAPAANGAAAVGSVAPATPRPQAATSAAAADAAGVVAGTAAVVPPAARRQGTAEARAARIAAAKAERERKAKVAKVRNLVIAIGVAVVLALAAVIVIPHLRSGHGAKPVVTPAGLTTYQGVTGSLYGQAAAPVTITLFEDFQCPVCLAFEKADGAELDNLVSQGKVRVLYSMVSILDRSSNGNRYSTRSANAFFSAPQADRKALHDAFYANQPPETNGKGRTDAQILATAKGAGVSSAAFTTDYTSGRYEGFVASNTDYAVNNYGGAQFGTPTMLVNGSLVPNPQVLTPSTLDQTVAQAPAS